MPTLLHIDTSPRLDHSVTRRLTAHFVRCWLAATPGGRVLRRDLGSEPPPHPDAATLAAVTLDPAARDAGQAALAELPDRLLEEFEQSDWVLLGVPTYNFSVPSGLKAWFDLASRPGRTFRYGPHGHEGLVSGKTVVAIMARGGLRSPQGSADDLAEAQVAQYFRFMGLDDIRFVHADAQDIDPDTARASELRAQAEIERLAAGTLDRQAPPAIAAR